VFEHLLSCCSIEEPYRGITISEPETFAASGLKITRLLDGESLFETFLPFFILVGSQVA
jgi:hypothetical protein